jgi:dihydroorotase
MSRTSENETKFDYTLVGGQAAITSPSGDIQIVKTDIGILDGKVAQIGYLRSSPTEKKIDVEGLHILPGVVDSQVHFREPGLTHKEDLETGTKAALLGGVTAVFEMPNTQPSTTDQQSFQNKVAALENRAWCNVGFYIGGSHDNIEQLETLEKLDGCCGIKVFMGSSTGSLLVEDDAALLKILQHGKRRMAVHCEDEFRLRERKSIATEGKSAHLHPVWRDEETALIAVQRLIRLASQAKRPVHVLHVSTKQEVEFLAAHKNIATIEVLPQHLTLSSPECYERLGNFAQQNPPIRDKSHQAALWRALQKGVIDVIGSDHAPHTIEEKKREYPSSPSGMPGVQTLLPVMLNHVSNGHLSLEHLIRLISVNPAKIFNIQGHGTLEIGSSANLTIVDLKAERKIENKWIASRCGWTPYDGMKVKGWMKACFVNGRLAMMEDQLIDGPKGQLLHFK